MKINDIFKSEKFLFGLVAILNVLPFLFIRFFPSMDGPQHLYNSQVIIELLKGNQSMQEFFSINPVVVGYWLGHFLLALYNSILPAFLAEKLLIITYLLGLPYAFRYLVKSINPNPSYLTLLIFPFSFTYYFLMGYYTFSLGFIVFFLALGYYLRYANALTVLRGIILSGLLVLLFLSHAFVFALFVAVVGMHLGLNFINECINLKSFEKGFGIYIKKALLLLVIALPALVLLFFYVRHVMGIDSTIDGEKYRTIQLVDFLVRIRPLIVYHHEMESIPNYFYNLSIILVINYIIHKFLIRYRLDNLGFSDIRRFIFSPANIWALITLAFFIFYLMMPDRVSAGNLAGRVAVVLFYMLILWLATSDISRRFSAYTIAIVLIFFVYQRHTQLRMPKELYQMAIEANELEDFVKPNSIVYPVRVSQHWIDLHFIQYIGVDKPIINLGNPQCGGQFPVVWNRENSIEVMVGERRVFSKNYNNIPPITKNADYVVVYRYNEFLSSNDHTVLKENLDKYYYLAKKSSTGNAALYALQGEKLNDNTIDYVQ